MCCQWLPVALPVSFPSPPCSLDTESICQWASPALLVLWIRECQPVSFPSPPHSLDTEHVCQWASQVLLTLWPRSQHQLQTWPWRLLCHRRHHQCLCLPPSLVLQNSPAQPVPKQGCVLRAGCAGAPVHLKQLFFTFFLPFLGWYSGALFSQLFMDNNLRGHHSYYSAFLVNFSE